MLPIPIETHKIWHLASFRFGTSVVSSIHKRSGGQHRIWGTYVPCR
jgi:hypothetical protein